MMYVELGAKVFISFKQKKLQNVFSSKFVTKNSFKFLTFLKAFYYERSGKKIKVFRSLKNIKSLSFVAVTMKAYISRHHKPIRLVLAECCLRNT